MAEEKVFKLSLEEPPIHPQAQQYYCELVIARNQIADMWREISGLQRELHDMKQDLCYHCGKYKMAHEGACDGCRWRAL